MMQKDEKIWWIYSTFPHREEALSMARKLLAQRLIACANIGPEITSLYHWEGALREENEVALIAKTPASRLHAAMDMIRASHSYELPCVVSLPIEEGNPAFLRWVASQTT